MSTIPWKDVSPDTIWKLMEKSIEISDEDFDIYYDKIVEVLKRHGTFSEGGIDPGDFSSSRYVDQCTCIGVVARIALTNDLQDALAQDLSQVLKQTNKFHCVVIYGNNEMLYMADDSSFLRADD